MPKAALGIVKAYQEGSEEQRKQIVDGLPYDTGPLKPPAQHRFQKGNKSGGGRPRGRKNLRTQVQSALAMPVTIKENGRTKKVDASEASLLQLAAQAAQGDKKAIALLFEFARKTGLLGGEATEVAEPMFSEIDVGVWQQVSALMSEGAPVEGDSNEPKDDKE